VVPNKFLYTIKIGSIKNMSKTRLDNRIRQWKLENETRFGRSAEISESVTVPGEYLCTLKQFIAVNGIPVYLEENFHTTVLGDPDNSISPNADQGRLNRSLTAFDKRFMEYYLALSEEIINAVSNIVPVITEEYPVIEDIWQKATEANDPTVKRDDIPIILANLRNNLPHLRLISIRDAENSILGFAGIDEKKLELLYVHPDHTGNGYGKKLLVNAVWIGASHLEVIEGNEKAISLYNKFGFVKTATFQSKIEMRLRHL
jgi:putative acetyltransferase